jgi:transposase InsO family protein
MVSLADRRRGAKHLEQVLGVSERRACRVVEIARTTKRRPSGRIEENALVRKIHELSERYPRFGYRKIFDRLKTLMWRVGRERVRLLRRREGLRVPQKAPKRRRRGMSTIDPHRATYPNHVWSYDFVADQTTDGKTLRFLTVIDEFTRRALWIECARHLTSVDVVRVLEQLVELHGKPTIIKSDNGPEFVAEKVQQWIETRSIGARFIEPGSPWQNGHNESFNGVFRDGCLNRWLFESVREAREAAEAWRYEYNQERPHGSLGGLTPSAFFEREEEDKKEAA